MRFPFIYKIFVLASFSVSLNQFAKATGEPGTVERKNDNLISCENQGDLAESAAAASMPLPAKIFFDGQFFINPAAKCSNSISTTPNTSHGYRCYICAQNQIPSDQKLVFKGEKILKDYVKDINANEASFLFDTESHGTMSFKCVSEKYSTHAGNLKLYCQEVSKLTSHGINKKPINLRHRQIKEVEASVKIKGKIAPRIE